MGHIGDFGVEKPPVEQTFGYFGDTFRVNPNLTDLALIDLFATVSSTDDGGAAITAMRSMVEAIIHPDDLGKFWNVARAHRQSMEDVAQLAVSVIGALAERPTVLPSDSSDGQQPTDTRSTAGSSSPVEVLDGRPDLQVAVIRRLRETG